MNYVWKVVVWNNVMNNIARSARLSKFRPSYKRRSKQRGKKKPQIYSEREAAATWLLTRCGPELRRYTEKPGVFFFSDVFFVTWSQYCGSLCGTIEAVK